MNKRQSHIKKCGGRIVSIPWHRNPKQFPQPQPQPVQMAFEQLTRGRQLTRGVQGVDTLVCPWEVLGVSSGSVGGIFSIKSRILDFLRFRIMLYTFRAFLPTSYTLSLNLWGQYCHYLFPLRLRDRITLLVKEELCHSPRSSVIPSRALFTFLWMEYFSDPVESLSPNSKQFDHVKIVFSSKMIMMCCHLQVIEI